MISLEATMKYWIEDMEGSNLEQDIENIKEISHATEGACPPTQDNIGAIEDHLYLDLTLISAQGLKDVCMFGNMSPYAMAWINPSEKHSTQISHNAGCSPVWNHRFLIPLTDVTDEDSSLSIQVHSHGHVADTLLGSVKIPLLDISSNKADTVQYMACQLQRPSGRIQGLLNLSVQICDGTFLDTPETMSTVEGSSTSPGSSQRSSYKDLLQIHEDSSCEASHGSHFKVGSENLANEACTTSSSPNPSSGHTTSLASTKHHQAGGVMAAPDILDSGDVELPTLVHAHHHSHAQHISSYHSTGTSEFRDSSHSADQTDPTGLGFDVGYPGGTLGAYALAEAGSTTLYDLSVLDGNPNSDGTSPSM